MAKTRGEGRAGPEKAQRVLSTPESRRARREQLRAEERDWAARSGPVTTRKKEDE